MGVPIRILHLDDSPLDAQLVALALEIEQEKLPTQLHHVQTREEFLAALARKDFDLILSDYRMPNYDGDQALKAAQQICPEIPFIMVTGELREELVIETLKRGATDYVLKDRIFRLIPAIQRALAESENRRKKQEAERERERLLQEVQRSKGELFAIIQAMHGGVIVFDLDGHVVLVNEAQAHLLGYRNPSEIERSLSSYTEHFELYYPDGTPVPVGQWPIQRIMRGETIESSELKMKRKDNENGRFFSFSGRPVKDGTGK